jgi:O-antigen biosynthesis protein
MFISRRCLNRVGLFDEKVFGRGYGEENDFCMRAWRRGYRSVLCSNLFVRHQGRVSFTDAGKPLLAENLKKLHAKHPYYTRAVQRYIRKDPVAPVRQAAVERIRQNDSNQRSKLPGILYILPDQLIGGTERHLHDLAGGLLDSMRVHIARPGEQGIRFETFVPIPLTTIRRCRLSQFTEVLNDYIEKNHVEMVHLQHLVPLDVRMLEFFKQLRVPYGVTLHDY